MTAWAQKVFEKKTQTSSMGNPAETKIGTPAEYKSQIKPLSATSCIHECQLPVGNTEVKKKRGYLQFSWQ
jgi:hypothetical protein